MLVKTRKRASHTHIILTKKREWSRNLNVLLGHIFCINQEIILSYLRLLNIMDYPLGYSTGQKVLS